MDKGVLYYQKVRPDMEFIDEVFSFDVRNLESTDGNTLSMYTIALAQYLIYYKSQINSTKAEIYRYERTIDIGVGSLLSKDVTILKKYKAKKDAISYIISQSTELSKIRDMISNLHEELLIVEGIDKGITELIAAFKRELTRRENELYAIRTERKN